MKSLPENEFWKAIKHRLESYQEDPADDWDKIAGAIPSGSQRVTNLNRSTDILASVILAFALGFQVALLQVGDRMDQTVKTLNSDLLKKVIPEPQSPLQKWNEGSNALRREEIDNDRLSGVPTKRHTATKRTGLFNEPVSKTQQRDTRQTNLAQAVNTHDVSNELGGENKPVLNAIPLDGMSRSTEIEDSVALSSTVKPDTAVVSSPVAAQRKKRGKKFQPSVYLQLTPSLAYQKITPSKNDEVTIQKINSPGIISPQRLGVSMEIGFQMQVSSKLELYTSLSYYQQQHTLSYIHTSDDNPQISQLPDSRSYTLTPGSTTRTFSYNMRNAGLATGVLYFLRGDKLTHKIGGGIQYQKGLMRSREGDTYSNSQSDYFSYRLLYRLEYVLNRKTNFFIQPMFTHSIFSNEKLNEPFRIKPYRAGLGFGVVYHF